MMKKLFLLLFAALAAAGAWAEQTDVTTTYFSNMDFEGTYTAQVSHNAGERCIFKPEGWTVTYLNANTNDITALKSGDQQYSNFSGKPQPENGDAQTYWIRYKWKGSTNQSITLSQESSTELPAGAYELKADVYATSTSTQPRLSIAGKSIEYKESAWTTKSISFYLAEPQKVTIEYYVECKKNGDESFFGLDNLKLLSGRDDATDAAITANQTYTDALARITSTAEGCEYGYKSTALVESDLTKWDESNFTTNNGDQHWSGPARYNYFEQKSNGWSESSWTTSGHTTVNLPAGKYAFVIAGRASAGVTSTLAVSGVDSVSDVTLAHKGDNGRGIATDGTATYDAYQYDFANNGAGRGWEWSYAEFTLTAPTDVTFTLTATASTQHSWVSFADPVLYYDATALDAMQVIDAKAQLRQAIDACAVPTANVGTAAFQIAQTSADARTQAKAAAETVYNNATATLAEVNAAKAAVEAALTYNAAAESDIYAIIMADTAHNDNGHAVTFTSNSGNGGYGMAYSYAPGATQMGQAVHFKSQGDNAYTLYITDRTGDNHYLCAGSVYSGGDDNQLRMTDDETKALTVRVEPTATEGIYNLRNTKANNLIGANGKNDHGFYTVATYNAFRLETLEAQTITLTVAEGQYATLCLPFAAQLPQGMTAYTIAEADIAESGTITPKEAQTLEACQPYLIYAPQDDYTFTGTPLAAKDTYTEGALTGTFVKLEAPAESYVLQVHNGNVAFYHVGDVKPAIEPNRVYLTHAAPAATDASEVKVLALDFGTATALDALRAQSHEAHAVYNVQGQRLAQPRRGLNIINGKKLIIK